MIVHAWLFQNAKLSALNRRSSALNHHHYHHRSRLKQSSKSPSELSIGSILGWSVRVCDPECKWFDNARIGNCCLLMPTANNKHSSTKVSQLASSKSQSFQISKCLLSVFAFVFVVVVICVVFVDLTLKVCRKTRFFLIELAHSLRRVKFSLNSTFCNSMQNQHTYEKIHAN